MPDLLALSPQQQRLLHALTPDAKGVVCPHAAGLARRLGLGSARSIRLLLAQLEARGVITRLPRRRHIYWLLIHPLPVPAGQEAAHG